MKIHIKCNACGFDGISIEPEDRDDDVEDFDEDDDDGYECPKCGAIATEDADEESDNQEESTSRGEVVPFSLFGEKDERNDQEEES